MPQAEASYTDAGTYVIDRASGAQRSSDFPGFDELYLRDEVATGFVVEWQLNPLQVTETDSTGPQRVWLSEFGG